MIRVYAFRTFVGVVEGFEGGSSAEWDEAVALELGERVAAVEFGQVMAAVEKGY